MKYVFPIRTSFSSLEKKPGMTLKKISKIITATYERRKVMQRVLETIDQIWLNKPRLTFAELVLPALKEEMSDQEFMEALANRAG